MIDIDFFDVVLYLAEFAPYLLVISWIMAAGAKPEYRKFVALSVPLGLVLMVSGVIVGSWLDAKNNGYDLSLPSKRQALETYIEDGAGDLEDIIEGPKYANTFGLHDVRYLVTDLVMHTILHLDRHNGADVPEAYNKGNDWFRATLGEPMVYTSGIYKNGDESLWDAQHYKLDYVAHAIELKEGEQVLDIGCGWGRLVKHFTEQYKAKVTGVTLSIEQQNFGIELNKGNGGTILLQDAMKLSERNDLPAQFDKITCLEMAEHVGIRRYTAFLKQVHGMLKDDGILYFQVAGLRRQFQYEDLSWGLFMGEHVFPGADASCPLGWVTAKLEQSGFEVQRVSNLGNHYSRTLDQWLSEWRLAEAATTKKYGAASYRRWEVFLKWSVRIAREGSSTVFMITATKHGQTARRIQSQKTLAPQLASHKTIPMPK